MTDANTQAAGTLLGDAFVFFADQPGAPFPASTDQNTETNLTALSDGRFTVGYNAVLPGVIEVFDPQTGEESRENVFLSDTISAFGGEFVLDTTDVTSVALSSGGFLAAWATQLDFNNTLAIELALFNAAGEETATTLQISEGSSRFPTNPTLTDLGGDRAALLWESASDTWSLQVFNAGLQAAFAEPVELSAPRGISGEPEVQPLGNGNLAVAYGIETFDPVARSVSREIYLAQYDGTTGAEVGEPLALDISVPDGETYGSSGILATGAMADGGVAVLYTVGSNNAAFEQFGRAYVEVFDSDGQRHTDPSSPREIDFGVPAAAVGLLSGSASRDFEILGLPDGGYAIAFGRTDDGVTPLQNFPDTDTYLMLFNADEAQTLAPTRINTETEGEQGGLDLALRGTDALLASFYSENDGLNGTHVQAIALGDGAPLPENALVGTAGADVLLGEDGLNEDIRGLAGDDTLNGRAGDDTLNGGQGADLLIGGQGSDVIYVDDVGDRVAESRKWAGSDTVISSVDFRMGRKHIEDLELTGDARLGAGNGLRNTITGNDADNVLDGGKNVDTLIGGLGDDRYLVRAPGDNAVEQAGEGIDTVLAFRAYKLDANVENLFLQTLRNKAGEGVAGVNGIGNDLDNTIVGNPFDNVIIGRDGMDTLRGQAGADMFVFDRAFGDHNVDHIVDFNTNEENEGDILGLAQGFFGGNRLGTLDAAYFVAGTEAQNADQQFIFDQASGRFWFDIDGSGELEQQLVATFDRNANVTHNDIEII